VLLHSRQSLQSNHWTTRLGVCFLLNAICLCLLPQVCESSYPTGGWDGDWTAEIRPGGCTLETHFKDITAVANPNIDQQTYVTHDPFRLFFSLTEKTFDTADAEIAPGSLILWLQPLVWENIAEHQLDIVGVSIGEQQFEIHRALARPDRSSFYLVGKSAVVVYEYLIADRQREVEIVTIKGEVFRRKIPLSKGRTLRFRTLSRMFEACYQDRNP